MAETRRTRGTNDDKFVRLYWVALHYRVPYFVRPSNTLKLFTRRRMLAFHLGPCRAEHSTNAECKTFIRTNSGFAVALNHLNAITLDVSRTKEKREYVDVCARCAEWWTFMHGAWDRGRRTKQQIWPYYKYSKHDFCGLDLWSLAECVTRERRICVRDNAPFRFHQYMHTRTLYRI